MRRVTIRLGVVVVIPRGWDYFQFHGILFRMDGDQAIPVRSL